MIASNVRGFLKANGGGGPTPQGLRRDRLPGAAQLITRARQSFSDGGLRVHLHLGGIASARSGDGYDLRRIQSIASRVCDANPGAVKRIARTRSLRGNTESLVDEEFQIPDSQFRILPNSATDHPVRVRANDKPDPRR